MILSGHWTAGLHHDGSALYVSNPLPAAGEAVTIRLRAPLDAPIQHVFLRSAPDGESHHEPMRVVEQDAVSAYWEADLRVSMPRNPYRFKILTPEGAYYLTAEGVSRATKPDCFDFKLLADYAAPTWVYDAVFYQIFPDRFHNGDPSLTVPVGAWSKRGFSTQQRKWGDLPLPWDKGGALDFFGGDLPGITQKLDYLQNLGVNALYLNPIFPSQTNHRYDSLDFDHIDPYLGGDDALVELRQALDAADMRLILDVTPNHISWQHPWFKAAQADENAPTADFFTFYDEQRGSYATWLGIPSLVKLNYAGNAVRDAMYRASDSVMRRWLAEPYRIDGWRLDVQNMTARQGMTQLGHEIGREMRNAVKADNPGAYVMGEHFYDATPHLQGDELDAVMNYQGFNIPVRRWLCGLDVGMDSKERPDSDRTLLPGEAAAEQMQAFMVAVPWVIALQQFNQLGNHDTFRILEALGGDRALLKLGVALLMTYIGVPCIYYGDEIGMMGGRDPDNRRCMPWNESEWDNDLRAYYQKLIQLRRTSSALRHGGLQFLYAEGDVIAYQRHSPEQRLIVVGYRGQSTLEKLTIPVRHGGLNNGVMLVDVLSGQSVTVTDGAIQLENVAHGQAYIFEAR